MKICVFLSLLVSFAVCYGQRGDSNDCSVLIPDASVEHVPMYMKGVLREDEVLLWYGSCERCYRWVYALLEVVVCAFCCVAILLGLVFYKWIKVGVNTKMSIMVSLMLMLSVVRGLICFASPPYAYLITDQRVIIWEIEKNAEFIESVYLDQMLYVRLKMDGVHFISGTFGITVKGNDLAEEDYDLVGLSSSQVAMVYLRALIQKEKGRLADKT